MERFDIYDGILDVRGDKRRTTDTDESGSDALLL